MGSAKKGPEITTNTDRCTGCEMCQLYCSFTKTREFNPSKARIMLDWDNKSDKYTISFAESCDNCGVCARSCPYGALSQERRGV